jgi:hypothetical protein
MSQSHCDDRDHAARRKAVDAHRQVCGRPMTSSSSDARLRTRNESRETRVDRIVIVHPDGMAAVPEISQSFSTVRSFAQGQDAIPHLRNAPDN